VLEGLPSTILASHLEGIINAFSEATHLLRPSAKPLFMEDGNSAYGYKSIRKYCSPWRIQYGII
jgi:hypothetical protein